MNAEGAPAEGEIAHWFKPEELVEYENVHGQFAQPAVQ